MENLKYKFIEFMRGRNGADELYYATLALTVVLDIVDLFVRSRVLSTIVLLLILLTFFRYFSKNLYARQRENAKFLEVVNRVRGKKFRKSPYDITPEKSSAFKKKLNAVKIRFRDRKTHVFKKCPGCKAVIRLPKKKGTHTVCCPRCSTDFQVKIR